jgi:hypothetical protein
LPTFHFTIISEGVHDVGLGVVLDDIAAARAHAEQMAAIAATRSADRAGYRAGAKIQVTDANGTTVLEVPIAARW